MDLVGNKIASDKAKSLRYLLLAVFVVLLVVSYIYKSDFKSINNISSSVLSEPIQNPVEDQTPIVFNKDNYHYILTPLYNYTLNGLVLHTQKYDSWWSLDRTDKTFTKDVCLIWGNNISNKAYQDPALGIKQDFRFCLFSYSSRPRQTISNNELSNNHLIPSNQAVLSKILNIEGGDQVRIRGKLVNVQASAIGATGNYEYKMANWNTSVSRDDSGAGACEIIYVEAVEIIKKGNKLWHNLYYLSLIGSILVIGWSLADFVVSWRRL